MKISDEILQGMIKIWMKNHLVSDSFAPKKYKEWQIMLG